MAKPDSQPTPGLSAIEATILGAVAERAFPGGVFASGGSVRATRILPFGRLAYDGDAAAVEANTIYDLASLTKVVVTATMAMILVDEGRLDLDRSVADFVPGMTDPVRQRITLGHLLTHSSGLPAWAPLFQELQGKDAFVDRIAAMDLEYQPGVKSVYSDLGFILLGAALERLAGETIESFARRRIFEPLGLNDAGFRPKPPLLPRIAPTEFDERQGRFRWGEVHDENAHAMGGVAPHAGLFGTAADLVLFAQAMLIDRNGRDRRLASRPTVERFTRCAQVPGSSRGLGWDTPSPGSSAGSLLSSRSFGHTGFTGTSLWIDPERDLFVILLTNRVHPTRENQAIRRIRPAVADAAVVSLQSD